VLRLLTILLVALLVGGCASSPPTEAPPDPVEVVRQAAANIRAANTFRISVDQSGPQYQIYTDYATVLFRRAIAQYVAPGMMEATIRVIAAGLTISVDVFSHGTDQWYRAIWTGNQWVNQAFAPDFNPETLIAEDTGFQAAMKALIGLSYKGTDQLESGAQAYHLAATANGPDVAALLGGLIQPVGTVNVDVYVDTETRFPDRFIITEFNSPYAVVTEPGKPVDPIVWTIDLYDINAAPDIATPEAVNEATLEATAEATPEAAS
jgi:LppX_LprAFG lipoprotein